MPLTDRDLKPASVTQLEYCGFYVHEQGCEVTHGIGRRGQAIEGGRPREARISNGRPFFHFATPFCFLLSAFLIDAFFRLFLFANLFSLRFLPFFSFLFWLVFPYRQDLPTPFWWCVPKQGGYRHTCHMDTFGPVCAHFFVRLSPLLLRAGQRARSVSRKQLCALLLTQTSFLHAFHSFGAPLLLFH